MSNFHRITWMEEQLRSKKYPTLRDIADKYEITTRQVSRDIEYMRYTMGAPIEYSKERNGYYYTDETFSLPAGFITGEEKKTLGFLAHQYEKSGGTDGLRLAELFSRISGVKYDEDTANITVKAVSASSQEASAFDILKKAIMKTVSVEMIYTNSADSSSSRLFDPYKLFVSNKRNYVAGFCNSKREIRVFRLDRISEVKLTDIAFNISPLYNEQDYRDDMSFKIASPFTAKVSFPKGVDKDKLINGIFGESSNTCLIRFVNSRRFISVLLSIDKPFVIISPHWLKLCLADRISEIYQDNFRQGHNMSYPASYTEYINKFMEDLNMGRKILDGIKLGMTWTSYISSAEAALVKAGMWDGETWKLMGQTGMAFHFIIHKETCPSSVTVYDWIDEHSAMMDRIGIHSESYQTFYDQNLNTYQDRHQDAVNRIKESIDRGIPAVAWAVTPLLEFGLIYGYDDEDKVFSVVDCTGQKGDPLLYENLGKSEVPILFYQIFRSRADIDNNKAWRDSLKFGISEWNKEFHISPEYASGRKAYQFLISALEKGKFNDFGLAYVLSVYGDSKKCIKTCFGHLAAEGAFKGIERAADIYGEISSRYDKMTALVPFSGCNGSGCTVDRNAIPEVLDLVRECLELEENAMSIISEII